MQLWSYISRNHAMSETLFYCLSDMDHYSIESMYGGCVMCPQKIWKTLDTIFSGTDRGGADLVNGSGRLSAHLVPCFLHDGSVR